MEKLKATLLKHLSKKEMNKTEAEHFLKSFKEKLVKKSKPTKRKSG